MSSDESNQLRSDESHSDDPLKEKKVCFICGSHTIFIINIHEPRSGPNMIDVISEKFKMRPLNDDKFLCYSCNNWLINWYSMQNKYDRHNETDSSTAASTAREIATTSGGRSGNTSSSSGTSTDRRSTKTAAGTHRTRNAHAANSKRPKCPRSQNDAKRTAIVAKKLSRNMLNDTHGTVSEKKKLSTASPNDSTGIVFTAAIEAVRTKLRKYLYCPNKRKRNETSNDEWHMPLGELNHHWTNVDCAERSPKIVNRRSRDAAPYAENKDKQLIQQRRRYTYCELCKRSILRSNHHRLPINCRMRRQKSIQICRKCKLSMHMHICNRLICLRPNRRHPKSHLKIQQEHKDGGSNRSSNSIDNNDILNRSNIVNKLKLLGTTIYYEPEKCSNRKQERNNEANGKDWRCIHSISSIDEIDTDTELKPTTIVEPATKTQMSKNERSTENPNEIVLTFNTVVTEVFPMQLLTAGIYYTGIDQPKLTSSSTNERVNSFHEIIKNVPKSLTITLA